MLTCSTYIYKNYPDKLDLANKKYWITNILIKLYYNETN